MDDGLKKKKKKFIKKNSFFIKKNNVFFLLCITSDVPITPTPRFTASRVVWQLRFLSISQLRRQQTSVGWLKAQIFNQ